MDKDTALDLALEALKHGVTRMNQLGEAKGCMPLHDAITAIKQARSAPVQEPIGYLFQHEETGLTTVVDVQQVEWGFEKNNPRHQKIGPLYTTPPAAPVQSAEREEPVAWIFKPNRELLWPNEVERKNPLELNEYAPLYTTPSAAPVQEPDFIARLKHPEDHYEFTDPKKANAVLMSLCQEAADALAAPVQEPVAWMQPDEVHISLWKDDYHTIPLYTTPPAAQRQWVGLNWEDMPDIRAGDHAFLSGARWAEAKLKEKNT
jgi:hypothetical protein